MIVVAPLRPMKSVVYPLSSSKKEVWRKLEVQNHVACFISLISLIFRTPLATSPTWLDVEGSGIKLSKLLFVLLRPKICDYFFFVIHGTSLIKLSNEFQEMFMININNINNFKSLLKCKLHFNKIINERTCLTYITDFLQSNNFSTKMVPYISETC